MRRDRVVSTYCLLLLLALVACEPRHSPHTPAGTGTTLRATSAPTPLPATTVPLIPAPSPPTAVVSPPSGSTSPAPREPNPRIIRRVPWVDRTAAVNTRVATGYTLPTSLTAAPGCRLRDVETVATFGPGLGTIYGALHVHNVSEAACSLHGRPTLALVDAHGVVWQSTGDRVAADESAAGTVVLAPNSWAVSGSWPIGQSCGGFGVTTQLVVSIPGDPAKRTVPFKVGGRVCPAATRRSGVRLDPIAAYSADPASTRSMNR